MWNAGAVRRVLALVLMAVAGTLHAQSDESLAPPAASYPDSDPAAVRPDMLDPQDRSARQNLEQVLRRAPKNVPAKVQNAWLLLARGTRQRGYDAFEDAIRSAPANSLPLRHAHWNYGWALFAGADVPQALEHWQLAAQLHGGHPTWVPTTFAVGLWLTGRSDLALDYYGAAVKSDPDRWGEASGLAEATRNWGANEKLAIEAVHAAWRARNGG